MEKEPKYILEAKLSRQRIDEILKKFRGKGATIDADQENFIVHAEKDGKKFDQCFPQWEHIPYEDGRRVKIEDDIKNFLDSLKA